MQRFVIIPAICLLTCAAFGQRPNYDSIRKILQQDSIEYEQQIKEAGRLKSQTDSIIEKQLGHVPDIAPDPKEDSIRLSKKVQALLLAQQMAIEKEKREYYLFGGTVLFIFIVVLVAVKRRQLKEDTKA